VKLPDDASLQVLADKKAAAVEQRFHES